MFFRQLTVACTALAALVLSAVPAAPAQKAVATDISCSSPYGRLGEKRYAHECDNGARTDPANVSAAHVRSIDVWVCHHRWWHTEGCDRAMYDDPYHTP
ncbi:hypothetical protein [Streptomyces sp. NPDC007369]|uniref:hypothetical protein n=1 Tax=Streptomyces sp. NPDC007369 TaxID=3154589 RepID=UPI0033FCDAAD